MQLEAVSPGPIFPTADVAVAQGVEPMAWGHFGAATPCSCTLLEGLRCRRPSPYRKRMPNAGASAHFRRNGVRQLEQTTASAIEAPLEMQKIVGVGAPQFPRARL